MRDEKEERKKQSRSNKQTRQSNTAHPRQSLFLEKMSCLGGGGGGGGGGLEPTTLYTLDRALGLVFVHIIIVNYMYIYCIIHVFK